MTEQKVRGRPEHEPQDSDRLKVRVLKAGGMSNEAIAEAIGISEPTLRKHYFLDIEVGAARVTAEIMMARYRAAMGGNVTAQNKLLEVIGTVPSRRGRAPREPALGKKEQAQADALDAHEGGGWSKLIQ